MIYKAVHILCDPDLEETISFLLQDVGYEGTSYEKGRLIGYCKSDSYDENAVSDILSIFNLVSDQVSDVENENWNASWEENFTDAIISKNIQARAPFHPSGEYKHDIIITPKMAFGTGHHETTSLSARALEKLDCKNKAVLDMGCGSGLLAILASQKGAKRVLAIDYDINSVNNAKENVQLNTAQNVEVLQADSLVNVTDKFDIVLSNIVKNINLRLLPEFVAKLKTGGHLILCGFMAVDLNELKKAASAQGLNLVEHNIDSQWLQTHFVYEH